MNYLFQQVVASILLVIFTPLYMLLFFFCVISQGFPVLYRERRLGLRKKEFVILKFRTMSADCRNFDGGRSAMETRCDKCPNDTRITAIGHLLRRFSMDELPQLWNVIKGDMALIGPRPITADEDLRYGKYSELLHSVKPGMTGLWQVSGRCLTTYHRRIAINRYYVLHRSWRLDLWILYKTIDAVISGRGAY